MRISYSILIKMLGTKRFQAIFMLWELITVLGIYLPSGLRPSA